MTEDRRQGHEVLFIELVASVRAYEAGVEVGQHSVALKDRIVAAATKCVQVLEQSIPPDVEEKVRAAVYAPR